MEPIEVFPLTGVLNIDRAWFISMASLLRRPALLLMALLLIISVGITALKRFEDADFDRKLWNIPVIIVALLFWPDIVLALKDLIDTFNTFLIREVFHMDWQGGFSVGFSNDPAPSELTRNMKWYDPASWGDWILNRGSMWILLISRNVIYMFYLVFFFFFFVLGPLILAKGIIYDEVETFLELLKEIAILFLWQTTYIIFVGFIYPDAGRSSLLIVHPDASKIGWIFVLAIMTLFVPSVTRKFGNHLGASFFPPGFKWGGMLLAFTLVGRTLGMTGSLLGLRFPTAFREKVSHWNHRFHAAEEFVERLRHSRHGQHLEHKVQDLERVLTEHNINVESRPHLDFTSLQQSHAEHPHGEHQVVYRSHPIEEDVGHGQSQAPESPLVHESHPEPQQRKEEERKSKGSGLGGQGHFSFFQLAQHEWRLGANH